MYPEHRSLLTLPREIRDNIYTFLALPEYVYTSTANPSTYDLHRSKKYEETYIDSRIYLPARPPTNILGTSRQLREEMLEFVRWLSRSIQAANIPSADPVEEADSNRIAARANQAFEEGAERATDDGSVRITIEVIRGMRGPMGYYVPDRESLSPRFTMLLPILSCLTKLKFVVWGGFEWWKARGERHTKVARWQISRFKRTTPDQTDEPKQAEPDIADKIIHVPAKPNPLAQALAAIVEHLPLVEEINVDVLIHVADLWNWDFLEENRREIQLWLDAPIYSAANDKLKQVYRRLIVVWDPKVGGSGSSAFCRKLEVWQDPAGEQERRARVSEGFCELQENWEDLPDEQPFTKFYDRIDRKGDNSLGAPCTDGASSDRDAPIYSTVTSWHSR